jgi:hypothetical protein
VSNRNPFDVTGSLSVGRAGHLKGEKARAKSFQVVSGSAVVVKLELPAPARRLLARRGRLLLALRATVADLAGNQRTVAAKSTVRAAG